VDRALPEPERRAFLGRAAAALLAVVGGGLGVAAGAGCAKPPADPQRPVGSTPGATPDQRPPLPMAGAVADRPPDAGPPVARADAATTLPPDAAPATHMVPIGGLVADPQGRRDAGARPTPKPAGIMPDRPQPTRGIRPDRPRPGYMPGTKGIRPDRPDDLPDPFSDMGKKKR
jgi:hypothetical protein